MEMAFTVRLLLLLIPSFFGVPISVFSQTDGKVAVDAYLSATAGNNSSWLSPSGDFAFGFRQLENKDLFLLSIWYAKIPDRTIVWYANGDSPVAPKGSLVNLTANDGLVLTSPQGQQLWKSETIVGVVAFGVLNDTGNFVLEDDNSESLWETFKNPTHTMLPGQDIEKGGKLSSQQSETNFSKGRFQLRMQDDGNLVLNSINLPTEFANKPYYASGTTGESNSSTAGTKLEFNSSGYMYVLRENGQKFNLKAQTVSARSYYLRATINFDGVFAQYSYPKNSNGNGSWSLVWSLPDNICRMEVDSGLGVCGYNSVCTLKSERPTCECPSGFSLLDSNDPYGDCKPDFIQGCEEDEPSPTKDIYEVQVLINTDWPTSDYMQLKPFTAESCNESCFADCLCAVAIFNDETCWKKKLPLSNGRLDSELNSQAFIKVRKGNSTLQVPQLPRPYDKKRKKPDHIDTRGISTSGRTG
ncbi:hypothetical protein M0R45_036683 [Rubus argutus]|uniref:Bulb-type lectin domain-containing protein n=1 Tax=Rubus argutus TaxID=59490 RepID=A0AAW1W0M1_RUBAR